MHSMNLAKALVHARHFNELGIRSGLSYLAVEKSDPLKVAREVEEYDRLLEAVKTQIPGGSATLKVHQFGAVQDPNLARRSIRAVVEKAAALKQFVWIDMERVSTVDFTIDLFEELWSAWGNVGICLQACLRRTGDDLKRLLKSRVPIRLVKGFYKANDFPRWADVTRHFEELLEPLLKGSGQPCVATHDLSLIEKAKTLIRENHLLEKAEFQFFNGVRDALAAQLVKEGFFVRIYIPYGHMGWFLWKGWPTFDNTRHIQRFFHCRVIH